MAQDGDDDLKSDRRSVLRVGVGIAAAAMLGGAATAFGIDLYATGKKKAGFDDVVETNGIPGQRPRSEIELIQSLPRSRWISFDKDTALLLGGGHPQYGSQKPPSQEIAIAPFHAAHLNMFANVLPAREDSILDVTGDIITLGSPSSNVLMRSLMGYSVRPNAPLFLTKTNTERTFPFKFSLDFTEKSIGRHSNGLDYKEPDWGIELPSGEVLYSKSRDGELVSDYLLITRMESPFPPYRTVLNFAGLHGPGCSALRYLFKDPKAFETIDKMISDTSLASDAGWQALIPVPGVERRGGMQLPLSIDLESAIVAPIL